MLHLQRILAVILISISGQVFCEDKYQPNSGDQHLDAALQQINKNKKISKKKFIRVTAAEFQVQKEKVTELFTHYKFTPADVLMTLSIADATGQPVNNISRAYFENKKSGWKFVLDQLNINQYTKEYKQINKDVKVEFIK